MPDPVTPFTVLGLLRDIQGNNGLSRPKKQELAVSIQSLESDYFAGPPPSPTTSARSPRPGSADRPESYDERRVAGVDGTPQPRSVVRLHRCFRGCGVPSTPATRKRRSCRRRLTAARPRGISALGIGRPEPGPGRRRIPDTIRVPSGLHLTDKTGGSDGPFRVSSLAPDQAPRLRTVRSRLAVHDPGSVRAPRRRVHSVPSCPISPRISPSRAPRLARSVVGVVTSFESSGLHEAESTAPSCPPQDQDFGGHIGRPGSRLSHPSSRSPPSSVGVPGSGDHRRCGPPGPAGPSPVRAFLRAFNPRRR